MKPNVLRPNIVVALVIVGSALVVSGNTVAGATKAPPGSTSLSIEWVHQFGGPGFDVVRAVGASDDAVYVFGAVSVPLPGQTYSGGPNDAFLRKYDVSGNELWTRQFGTSGDDFPMAGPVAVDPTGVYVAGYTDGTFPGETNAGLYDAFVRKYDHEGHLLWTDQFGTSGADVADGVALYGKALFVVGQVETVLPSPSPGGFSDAFVRRYDRAGRETWTRRFGGIGSEDFHGVAVDRTGIYAVGSVTPLPDLGDDVETLSDAVVAAYNFDGNVRWSRQFGAGTVDHLESVAVKHGNVYVAGTTDGTMPGQTTAGDLDTFVRAYDTAGSEVWTRQFGTSGNDGVSFRGLAADGSGVHVVGNVAGTLPAQVSAGGRDAFIRQYGPSGREFLTLQFGTSGDDRAIAVTILSQAQNAFVVGGRTSGAFPGFSTAGGSDAFVAKIIAVSTP